IGSPSTNQVEGTAFSGALATFTDQNPNGKASDFTATVDWGDGSSTTIGTITASTPDGGGPTLFTVSGSHTYAAPGSYKISVVVTDVGGAVFRGQTVAFTVADANL